MVARVVMSALMPRRAMTKPLRSPTTPPARAPDMATTEPTERSKSPAARQKSMVQAMRPTVATERRRPLKLTQEGKLGTKMAQQPKRRRKTTSMPVASQQARREGRERGEGVAGAVVVSRGLLRMVDCGSRIGKGRGETPPRRGKRM